MKIFILLSILLSLSISCISVKIKLKPPESTHTSFIHYSHYIAFGLIGLDTVNLQNSCLNGKAIYIKNYFSPEDILFAITTLGLYTPKSTQIECEFYDQDFLNL